MQASPNVKLYVGEVAFGDRPFEVTHPDHPRDFQWRSRHELWLKERVLNLVIQRFPADWQYGAYIDGDFTFTRHDWALEAVHLLQHYDWIQLFSSYTDLDYYSQPSKTTPSFAHRFSSGELSDKDLATGRTGYGFTARGIAATGGAWAFRRDAFEKCGGLLDTCILGSGDWHMAFGLAGLPDQHPQTHELARCGQAYASSITAWQNRASHAIKQNVGCMACYAIHGYHGEKTKRGYQWRWEVLRDNDFNPYTDIHCDAQGLYQLTDKKPKLRDGIRRYLRSRDEGR